MNKFILILLFSLFFNGTIHSHDSNPKATKTKEKKTYSISGKILQTSSYCGGARPTQEIIDKMAIPIAYEEKRLYIRKGKLNSAKYKVLKSFSSDKEGNFSFRLSKGTYSVIVAEQLNEIKNGDFVNVNQKVDTVCLKEWWLSPYYLLEVKKKNIQHLNFIFHHRCFVTNDIPCLTFTGPFPP